MKLMALFLLAAVFQVHASGHAQTVTYSAKAVPLQQLFTIIKQQTGYVFFYSPEDLKNTQPVTVQLHQVDLTTALEEILKDQPLKFRKEGNTILISLRTEMDPLHTTSTGGLPPPITGVVRDAAGNLLSGATIRIKGKNISVTSNESGQFTLPASKGDVLIVSYVGFERKEVVVTGTDPLQVSLSPLNIALDTSVVIVNTGYQNLALERATGSFVQINNELLNRRVSTNILDRLEGIASGLNFNKNVLGSNERLGISIRGRSTIDQKVSADPLIVVDNFPFEGDLSNINPNDVESITVLKDAAAASIWGARSGNGVIVITTKKGRLNQSLKVDLNANITVGEKPDLYASRNFLNSSSYIDAEISLFNLGYYNSDITNVTTRPTLSPVVEILAQKRSGQLTDIQAGQQIDALRSNDIRNDFSKYIYRKSINQQYSIGINGGSEQATYSLRVGADNNLASLKRNGLERITVNSLNTFKPFRNVTLTAGINYSDNKRDNNASGLEFGSITVGGKSSIIYPYSTLADAQGNPAEVIKQYRGSYLNSTIPLGFLDWKYRPLEELQLADNTSRLSNILLKAGINYKATSFLNFDLQYQYERQRTDGRNYRSQSTFYTRDLINQFSVRNATTGIFTYNFPLGGVLNLSNSILASNNIRGQLNFNRDFGSNHSIVGIAGSEIRDINTEGYSRVSYGYNDDYGSSVSNLNYSASLPKNPSGSGRISSPTGDMTGTVNRYISYYANAAYTYVHRYTFSASARQDGSNIFGVKTNDKIVPLWSAGIGWNADKEAFYHVSWLPYLKIRATYGINGNVYNASAYLTAINLTSSRTGAPYAYISSPPNQELRWERVKNLNLGIDFGTKNDILTGSVELFKKDGVDLIENKPLAPSSGFSTFQGNAAGISTKGMDLVINSRNLQGAFQWVTNFLLSYQKDKVTAYDNTYLASSLVGTTSSSGVPEESGLFAVVGKSLFGVYSYKWAGLDPVNGDPRGYLNGTISKDYLAILNSATPDNVIYHGSSRPTLFGSFRNSFSYKGFSLSANIIYKLNYYFRNAVSTTNLTQLINRTGGFAEIEQRWQRPGDETTTNIPSTVYPNDLNRSAFYQAAEINVYRADHIRLQDMTLGYDITRVQWKALPFSKVQLYVYINNLGILWRENDLNIDPDYAQNRLGYANINPNPRTIAIGVKVGL